ncbi:MAG: histidine kinase N-terminal 7TM domain-containing protein, partial [Ardenticatenaceae bacterium]
MQELTLLSILSFLNLLLSAANLIVAFSLVVYILTHNLWSSVARSFATIMAFVTIVYATDIILTRELSSAAATAWLKLQWVGIAMVPAAYLHFSDALLRTTNASSRWRRVAVLTSYGVGILFILAALNTDLVVGEQVRYEEWAPQLVAGPFFRLFMLYFFLTSGWGFANTLWARSRALTPTTRRRFSYLVASFAAPGLAVYPYLVFTSIPTRLSPVLLLSLLLVGNFGVAVMTVVMAYSVAYQGALAPDRVVKRSFLTYLLRGPILGVFVLLAILIVPRVEIVLGVPRETILIFTVVGGIILYEVLVRFLRPLVDFLAYRDDRDEFQILRSLEERLVTSGDLEQLLENLLTAICDLQRARNGAVVTVVNGALHVETICGNREHLLSLLATLAPGELARLNGNEHEPHLLDTWILWDSLRLLPLHAGDPESTLGFLLVEPSDETQPLTEREERLARQYVHQAEIALQDRRLQQIIFTLLQELTPQMETLQRWRSTAPFPDA